ncbi:MAG: glycosyltransferase family 39 protein, partial [Chloroflexi bacterium]|nr:glycosyltransferase family 39 protein [Chloroflexota bacterium]
MTVPREMADKNKGPEADNAAQSGLATVNSTDALSSSARWPIALVLGLHLLLGVIYSLAIPAWEAHDETGHFPYVRYLATYGSLPPPGEKISSWFDEAHQPPLYYTLGALATFWVDTSDYREPVPNPFGFSGTGIGGFNVITHDTDESFPYQGTLLALHLTRLLSVLLSTVVVWMTYQLCMELFPDRPLLALGAAMLNAFLPMFLYMGSVVNNDIGVTLWSSLVILVLARILRRGSDLKLTILVGLGLGCALLSKNGAIALIPLAIIVYAYGFLKGGKKTPHQRRGKTGIDITYLIHLTIAGVVTLLTSGWWYIR